MSIKENIFKKSSPCKLFIKRFSLVFFSSSLKFCTTPDRYNFHSLIYSVPIDKRSSNNFEHNFNFIAITITSILIILLSLQKKIMSQCPRHYFWRYRSPKVRVYPQHRSKYRISFLYRLYIDRNGSDNNLQ
jgi:hypothetical protein